MDVRKCDVCDAEFDAITRNFGRGRQRYCSAKCRSTANNRRYWRRRNAQKTIEELTLACVVCGVGFISDKYHPNALTCSVSCNESRMNSQRRLDFKKRENEKKPEFAKYSRRGKWGGNWVAALERDGHKCTICDSSRGLHVHHRDGSGESDSPNHKVENLQTLCNTCHRRIHTITYRVIDDEVVLSGIVFSLLGITKVRIA